MARKSREDGSYLLWALGGALIGSAILKQQIEQAKKSRVECERPEETTQIWSHVAFWLQYWKPHPDARTEQELTKDLAAFLRMNSQLNVEVCAHTPFGLPDLLIEDTVALELKVSPTKSERDRGIGQCADYSRRWVTGLVIIGGTASEVGRLRDILLDKALDHIGVWHFCVERSRRGEL